MCALAQAVTAGGGTVQSRLEASEGWNASKIRDFVCYKAIAMVRNEVQVAMTRQTNYWPFILIEKQDVQGRANNTDSISINIDNRGSSPDVSARFEPLRGPLRLLTLESLKRSWLIILFRQTKVEVSAAPLFIQCTLLPSLQSPHS